MTTTIALKEWSIVIQAIETGRHLLLVRKGGIRDPRGAFELAYREFLLYPTTEHQDESLVRPEFRGVFSAAESGTSVKFTVVAQAARVWEIRDPNILKRMESFHIWTPEFLEKRMSYRPKAPTLLVAVRALRLPQPATHSVRAEYAGCKSWVPLAEPVSVEGAQPVMDDRRFQAALEQIELSVRVGV